MLEVIINNLFPILLVIISSILTYFLNKEKNKLEILNLKIESEKKKEEAENIKTENMNLATQAANHAVQMWIGLYNQLSKDYKEKFVLLENQIRELEDKLRGDKEEIENLIIEISKLKKMNRKYKRALLYFFNRSREDEIKSDVLKILEIREINHLEESGDHE